MMVSKASPDGLEACSQSSMPGFRTDTPVKGRSEILYPLENISQGSELVKAGPTFLAAPPE
jgi:hypothetical protein